MTPVWRLIEHGPVDGALNMALDRAVQRAREEGSAPPTLRLYSWARPTVTLGRFQDPASVDAHRCADEGIDIVRRYTGGRGVLHDDELTYSVVASIDDGIPRGVAASYRMLSAALVETYRRLGVDAELTAHDRGDTATGACYLQNTRADLSAGTHKLAGSAQVWVGSTVLQHGSFTRSRDIDREAGVFMLDPALTEALRAKTITFADLCEAPPSNASITAAAVSAFEQVLGVELRPGGLTCREAQLAADCLADTEWSRVPDRVTQSRA